MKKILSAILCLTIVLGLALPVALADSETVNLKMSIWGNDARKTTFEELVKPFCEENNCTVEIVLVPFAEYMQKISIQLASKTAPM